MFTLDTTIDTIQNGKKQFVNTFVQNETVAEALNTFVDAQTEYTKKAVKIGSDTASTLTAEWIRSVQDAAKFNYAKFGEEVTKAYRTAQKKA